MKRFLAGVALVALLVGVAWATYTRDASGDGNVMITAAIEYLVANGITTSGTVTSTPAATVLKTPIFLAAIIIGEPGTPGALAADGTFFRTATLQAGRADAANASLISICGATAYTSQRATELAPGETWTIVADPGTHQDLNDYKIDGVNTLDGVRITYTAP